MKMMMTLAKYDTLIKRDFDNGAVLDEIRTALKQGEAAQALCDINVEAELQKRTNQRNALLVACEAIVARIEGDWDNAALVNYGPLGTNTLGDIKRIAELALGRREP